MQAIILAAGMGKRLKSLTEDNTKCMIKVNGVTLIERMLNQLDKKNLSGIIIVVGYEAQNLKDFITTLKINTPITYVHNNIYDKTNNIYSLFLARNFLLKEDTLLLESDLIFEDAVLDVILKNDYPSLALVSKYENWMDGSVLTIDEDKNIVRFLDKKQFRFEEIKEYYKTVNIYKFSKQFSNSHYVPFLEAYSKALGDNEYYEQVLKVIALLDKPEIKAATLDKEKWYEIDDLQDLDIAESIFTISPKDKLVKFQQRYGGYWRYPDVVDYCYLVNPYYPPQKMIDEIKANFDKLVREYPSGLDVNNLLAAKLFGIKEDYVCVGNGGSELIKSLMSIINGNMGVVLPTFEEYPNRKSKNEIISFFPQNSNYRYSADDIISFYDNKDIAIMLLINPDNPTGNFIDEAGMLKLCKWSSEKKIRLLLDESFIDFANTKSPVTMLDDNLLESYPNLIVLKSISKSYGIPGLRLGVIASAEHTLVSKIKKDVTIWNINSFAEFFLQIAEKYVNDYRVAISLFKQERERFYNELSKVNGLRIIPSDANFFLCELTKPATKVSESLLSLYGVFIKDLTNKRGFENGQFVRLSIKTTHENKLLTRALKHCLGCS